MADSETPEPLTDDEFANLKARLRAKLTEAARANDEVAELLRRIDAEEARRTVRPFRPRPSDGRPGGPDPCSL
jgi:hypothetical protein